MIDLNLHTKVVHTCLFVAVSAGAVITRTFWPAATMRVLSFCGMDLLARGLKSTRCVTWSMVFWLGVNHYLYLYICQTTFLRPYLASFQEHEKRCWSVDFNLMDPKLLASGSDDAKGN